MFNPFDEVVMLNVLDNIVSSLMKQPCKILFIYFNAKHADFIANHNAFISAGEIIQLGYVFKLYSNISSS